MTSYFDRLDGFLVDVESASASEIFNLIKTVNSELDLEKKKGKQDGIVIEGGLVHIPSSGNLMVVGDIHGDLESLLWILKDSGLLEDMEERRKKVLFLGDYGDRGSKSVEVYVALLRLKMAFPSAVILLRGNHEGPRDLPVVPHDLPYQLRSKFGDQGAHIYEELRGFFERLHHAAVVDGRYFFLHGGVPTLVKSIDDIVQANLTHPLTTHLEEMLWNDPMEDMKGTAPSPRGLGRLFGEDVTDHFLRLMNVKTLIRAHEPCPNGVSVTHQGMILTVFSRRGSPYGNMHAAYLNLALAEAALSAYDLAKSAFLF